MYYVPGIAQEYPMREPNNSEIDLGLRLFAHIAKLGGWLGRRGDPIGPLVLMRGMLSVMPIFQALAHCPGLIEQALRNPNVLGG